MDLTLTYYGKTKDVYKGKDGGGKERVFLKFKDSWTKNAEGRPDPGGNEVGGETKGLGKESLELSEYFFRGIKNNLGIETHFIKSVPGQDMMEVMPVKMIKGGNIQGLEVICRVFAEGSCLKRFENADRVERGNLKRGQYLDYMIEFTAKDDANNDPLCLTGDRIDDLVASGRMTVEDGSFVMKGEKNGKPVTEKYLCIEDDLINSGVISFDEYHEMYEKTRAIAQMMNQEFAERGDYQFIDFKMEYGRDEQGNLVMADDVSAGIMRVFKGGEIVEENGMQYYRNGTKLEYNDIYNVICNPEAEQLSIEGFDQNKK